jgi:hypothetical protein
MVRKYGNVAHRLFIRHPPGDRHALTSICSPSGHTNRFSIFSLLLTLFVVTAPSAKADGFQGKPQSLQPKTQNKYIMPFSPCQDFSIVFFLDSNFFSAIL